MTTTNKMKTIKTTNKMKTIKLLAVLFISALTFTACSEDDHDDDDHDHEEEVITTITYTLTSGDDVVTLTYQDLDPDDSVDGTYTVSGNLTANTDYVGELTVLNETDEEPEHLQEEIEAEQDEHEFFYSTTVAGLVIEKTDTDSNGYPVGFDTTVSTGDAAIGSLTIILKHEPTKPNDDDAETAGGSTDIEVTFAISVQ